MSAFRLQASTLATLVFALATSAPAVAELVVFQTDQYARSFIRYDATPFTATASDLDEDMSVFSASQASAFVLLPAPTSINARAAARSSHSEIAANATTTVAGFYDGDFQQTSLARYRIRARNTGNQATDLNLEFFIPPSFIELGVTIEFPQTNLFGTLRARICINDEFCAPSEGIADADDPNVVFAFDALLNLTPQNFLTATPDIEIKAPPEVDASALMNPAIQRNNTVFPPEMIVDFPALGGVLDLGVLQPDEEIVVTYHMFAALTGFDASFATGSAAVNDPFELSGDPVMTGVPLLFPGAAVVPLPPSVLLLLTPLITLIASRCNGRRR